MKVRVIAMLLAFVMAFSLVGCADKGSNADGETTDNGVASTDNSAVSAVSDGRVLYEAAMQMVYDGDMEGGIEGLRKAVDAEVAEDWQPSDITYAWWRMAQIYRLLDDAEGEAKVKEDYAAATGEERIYPSGNMFDDTYWDAYFEEPLVADDSLGILVYDGDNVVPLAEYRDFADEISTGIRVGENEQMSFCGVTYGMTKEEVFDALHMTAWGRLVAEHFQFMSFQFQVDPSAEEYLGKYVFVTEQEPFEEGKEYLYLSFSQYTFTDGVGELVKNNLVILEFENGILMDGAEGMIYFGN